MRHSSILNKGFSLVELLVVVSIFLVITAVVLFNQNKFSSDISISNVAYSIALEIRKAQVSGILVEKGLNDFNSAYGVNFKILNNNIVLQNFTDENNDLKYTDGEGDGIQQLIEGNRIISVCTYGSDNTDTRCMYPSINGEIIQTAIVFKRPDPLAIITDSGAPNSGGRRKRLEIIIQSSLGDRTRTIKAYNSGQVSVYNQ